MTRFTLLARALCSVTVAFTIGCGEKDHIVGAMDGSADGAGRTGGVPGQGGTTELGGATGAGGTTGAGGMTGTGAAISTGGIGTGGTAGTAGMTGGTGGAGGSVPRDAAVQTDGSGGSAGQGAGGTGAGGTGGKSGAGGVIGNGGASGLGGAPPVDGGRPLQNPTCCSSDQECREGYACAGTTCEYIVTLTQGQCWRDSDCPAGTSCKNVGICGCTRSCEAPDHPGTCSGSEGTDAGAGRDSGADGASVDGGGSLVVPCSSDPSTLLWDGVYVCGSCETEPFYPLVCLGGQLACPTSYVGTTGVLVTVPPGKYVLAVKDYSNMTGQCAYLKATSYPGFALAEPSVVTTAADPGLTLVLRAISSSPQYQATFDNLFTDRAKGESAIRSLVTLTDMTRGAAVAYTIGDPTPSTNATETIALQPNSPLAPDSWYRVTVYPGNTQTFAGCNTFDHRVFAWLTAPETTDIYTYSRPMVARMALVDKGGKGYLDFTVTEPLAGGDPGTDNLAMVAVDGVTLSGITTNSDVLRLDLQAIPSSFAEISLRIRHAIKSISGGTILAGTADNPHVTLDGDWAVYTFKAADMFLTDSNTVLRWNYVGK
jgi:hypothetical protein